MAVGLLLHSLAQTGGPAHGDGSLHVGCHLHWEAPKSVRRQRGASFPRKLCPEGTGQQRGVSPPRSVCPHDIQPKSCWDWGEVFF